MIEKSRLEELIKQGATIYGVEDSDIIEIFCGYIHHPKKFNTDIELEELVVCYEDTNSSVNVFEIKKENVFETKEEAEWYLEFGNIERTEKLTLPTWEKFNKERYFEFVGANNTWYGISMRYNKIYMQYSNDGEYFVDYYGWEKIDATEENYLEACRLAKKLFLGEKVEGESK